MFGFFWGSFGVSDEELFEAEQDEIGELQGMLSAASHYKRSTVPTGRYAKHLEVQEKSKVGEAMRQESEERRRLRSELLNRYKQAGFERAQASKVQRELALERVRQHRERNSQLGSTGKDSAEELRSQRVQILEERRREGARTAGPSGRRAHNEQLQASKEGLLAERRAAAARLKQEKEERAGAEREAVAAQLEEARQRVDRVREETRSDVAAAAAEQFYSARWALLYLRHIFATYSLLEPLMHDAACAAS